MVVSTASSERHWSWRESSLWVAAPTVTLLLFLPVMRRAARLDTYRYSLPNHDGVRVRSHAGLFLAYGLAVAAPSLLAAFLARRAAHRVSAVVAVSTLILAAVCEAFVSLATW